MGHNGYSPVVVLGLLIVASSLAALWALRREGFSGGGPQAQWLWFPGSRAQAQQLSSMGPAAPRYVGSSWTRDQICVSCTGMQFLYC